MRGKKAKRFRKLALEYVLTVMKKSAGEGYNEYNQAVNRIHWEPQLDNDGLPMMDPGGTPLMKPGKFPGTITCAWHTRVMYKFLKKQSCKRVV